MLKSLKKILIPLLVLFILLFLLFVTNQLVTLYGNLMVINPTLAWVTTGLIGILLLGLALVPFVLIIKLPSSISETESPAVYRQKIIKRLSKNSYIKREGLNVRESDGLEQALSLLNVESKKVIKDTATAVFLTTAVSQNGKLDALTVLITQSRMVWRVAHIYWQRPTLRDLVKLYANVAASGLVASEIEDIDISRQVEPIINALLKSPGRSLPVVGHAAHIITDSILEGSTNAFLTLRVGIITQKYCETLHPEFDKRKVRKSAFVEASGLLRSLVVESSGKVVKSVLHAMKNAGRNTVRSGVDALGRTAKNVGDSVGGWFKKAPSQKNIED